MAANKQSISLRIDADVLEWFKAQESGYQTRINAVLTSPEQTADFLALVDQASGNVSPMAAAALLATFNAEPDYGTQERVCSVLASGDERGVTDAIVGELPRLRREAPEWAEVRARVGA